MAKLWIFWTQDGCQSAILNLIFFNMELLWDCMAIHIISKFEVDRTKIVNCRVFTIKFQNPRWPPVGHFGRQHNIVRSYDRSSHLASLYEIWKLYVHYYTRKWQKCAFTESKMAVSRPFWIRFSPISNSSKILWSYTLYFNLKMIGEKLWTVEC